MIKCFKIKCVVGSCQDLVLVETFFSAKIFGLQSVYREKGNSDFRVGVEVVK